MNLMRWAYSKFLEQLTNFFPNTLGPYRIQVASANPQSMITGHSVLSLVPHLYYKDVRGNVDTLLLASGPVRHSDVDMHLLQWVIRLSPKVRRLGSICSGAFLLAETGLLDGRRATTHWAHAEEFGARFPKVLLDPDPIWLQDGNIYTSAGVVVLKNDHYSRIVSEDQALGIPPFGTELQPIDFVRFAEACGGAGFACVRPEEVRPALEAAWRVTDRPALIEATVE
jgi:putative intracellular protease/amidase